MIIRRREEEHSVWHAREVDDVLSGLEASREGLTEEEAGQRLEVHGRNLLPERRQVHPVLKFLHHYHNMLIYVLLGAAVVTALLDHWMDTWIILAVVVINGIIGYVQEGKAEKALAAVRNLLSFVAHVEREGDLRERPAEEVVPGDLIHIKSGDKVPADLRLIEVRELRINEASLTGESEAVGKRVDLVKEDASLGDRFNMAYSGSLVVSGTGTGIAVATGEHTEIGHINRMLTEVDKTGTPLMRQVTRFGRALTGIILAAGGAVFVAGYFWRHMQASELFLSVVGLAVAAIPEGLPAIMTITLAIGVQRMARRHAIIRRLPGVETLGSVSVICTDKTGTLTRGEMTATRVVTADDVVTVTGAGYEPEGGFENDAGPVDPSAHPVLPLLLRAAVLCNDARLRREPEAHIEGTPTAGALLTLAAKADMTTENMARDWQRLDAIPFESEHKFMATLHQGPEGRAIFLAGAPERLMDRCTDQLAADGQQPFDRTYWEREAEKLAAGGHRLMALAWRPAGESEESLSMPDVDGGLVFLGLAGLQDPPRTEAIDAVRECQEAGIRVKMITGDHALTAGAIAAQLGIGDGTVLTGAELDAISDEDLPLRAEAVDVFARVSPAHKLRLVTALQRQGWITAMTGDGVNDAPALKKADIGIAMGIKGSEATKEAAEMVLADDNFASIVHAVEEGRTVYDNLRKALLFMLPTNGGEAMVIIAAILFGLPLPITPAQILWINMVTAVTLALTLAFEPMERDVMQRSPRRPDESLTPGSLLFRIGFVAVLMTATTLGMYAWAKGQGLSVELARTLAVTTLIVGEIFYLFNSRLMTRSSLTLAAWRATPWVWGATGLVIVLQVLFTYTPTLQHLFGTVALSAGHWAAIIALNIGLFLIVEGEKAVTRKWIGRARARTH